MPTGFVLLCQGLNIQFGGPHLSLGGCGLFSPWQHPVCDLLTFLTLRLPPGWGKEGKIKPTGWFLPQLWASAVWGGLEMPGALSAVSTGL